MANIPGPKDDSVHGGSKGMLDTRSDPGVIRVYGSGAAKEYRGSDADLPRSSRKPRPPEQNEAGTAAVVDSAAIFVNVYSVPCSGFGWLIRIPRASRLASSSRAAPTSAVDRWSSGARGSRDREVGVAASLDGAVHEKTKP